jgi:hypothetical protein
LKLDPWSGAVYDGHLLFHGRDFQVIRSLDGVSKEGIAATVTGTPWKGDWATDPAAMDGGLQLALLWTRHVLGGASLPMAVGSYHRYGVQPAPGPLHAVLRGQVMGREKALSDVVFTDSQGNVVAELRGVQTILRPGESAKAGV